VNVVFTLYSRTGCHLCTEMLDQLLAMEQAVTFQVRVVDIDIDPALQSRYELRVPVLSTIDNTVLCEHILNRQAIIDYLASQIG